MPEPARRILFFSAVALVIAAAALLRTRQLDLRPMHTDEAVQAFILRGIWEEGRYVYSPEDLHGPVLVLSAFPVVWLSGKDSFEELDETTLRLTPALWGTALVILTLLAGRWMGWQAALLAALLTALSPMLVFYARYLIMETPLAVILVLFGYCVARYFETKGVGWIVAGGALAGVMHATKETFVLSLVAMAIGIIGAFLIRKSKEPDACIFPFLRPAHLALGLAAALLTSAALVSFFFTNPRAILDSYTTYLNYLGRGSGESGHEKPWFYYLELLGWKSMEGRFLWTEAITLVLASVGIAAAFLNRKLDPRRRFFVQSLALYMVASLIIYSAIPYKTPWSIMAPLHGAILLAGFGGWQLFRLCCCAPARIALAFPLAVACWHLGSQAIRANFPPAKGRPPLFADETRNPYLYSHTTPRLLTKIVKTVHELAALHPDGKSMPVSIIHPESGWPLPWYLRDMHKVGFWGEEPVNGIPSSAMAPVIIIDELWSMNLGNELADYVPTYCNLREDSLLVLYIRNDYFDQLVDSRSK